MPVTSRVGSSAFERLPAFVRASDDGSLADLLGAWGAPVEVLAWMLQDWRAWTDPEVIPFDRLPWSAAMAGLDLSTVPNADRRAVLSDPAWGTRGSEAAIRARVGVTLTGARQVWITCPYLGDDDRCYVRTLASETPDPAATLRAIRAEVPAWMQLTSDVAATGVSYTTLAGSYATYQALADSGKTYEQVLEG